MGCSLWGHKELDTTERLTVHFIGRSGIENKTKGKVKVELAQPCPTLCDPIDCSPPGSSVHGILQARILDWVAIPFSRGSSQLTSEPRSLTLQADSIPPKPSGKAQI